MTIGQVELRVEMIRTALHAGNVWLARPKYLTPSLDGLRKTLVETFIDKYDYRRYTEKIHTDSEFVCVDFAKLLWAFVSQLMYHQGWPYPWAFGMVWGHWPNGQGHALNWCRTDGGLYYVEPQDDSYYLWAGSEFKPFMAIG